jgi:hypothetical protein
MLAVPLHSLSGSKIGAEDAAAKAEMRRLHEFFWLKLSVSGTVLE